MLSTRPLSIQFFSMCHRSVHDGRPRPRLHRAKSGHERLWLYITILACSLFTSRLFRVRKYVLASCYPQSPSDPLGRQGGCSIYNDTLLVLCPLQRFDCDLIYVIYAATRRATSTRIVSMETPYVRHIASNVVCNCSFPFKGSFVASVPRA